MARRLDQIAAEFDSLVAGDFNGPDGGAGGRARLYELCDELAEVGDPMACAPVLFRTLEGLGEADLGSPGPVVHTLEGWREQGVYEPLLAESVRRRPTPLSVWMVNRLLNAKPADRESWLGLLRSVADNPAASEETKAAAERFVKYQGEA